MKSINVTELKAHLSKYLRIPEAIHVATAEILAGEAPEDPLEFCTHDERQSLAALSRGMVVRGV